MADEEERESRRISRERRGKEVFLEGFVLGCRTSKSHFDSEKE